MRTLLAATAALLVLIAAPSAHAAATVSSDGEQTRLTDSPGEILDVQLNFDDCVVDGEPDVCTRFSASAGAIEPGDGCGSDGGSGALCVRSRKFTLALGDRNDFLRVGHEVTYDALEVDGGPGEDSLDGGDGADTILGGAGDDRIAGGP